MMAHLVWKLLVIVIIGETLQAAELSLKWRQAPKVERDIAELETAVSGLEETIGRSVKYLEEINNNLENPDIWKSTTESTINELFAKVLDDIQDLGNRFYTLKEESWKPQEDLDQLKSSVDALEEKVASLGGRNSGRMLIPAVLQQDHHYAPNLETLVSSSTSNTNNEKNHLVSPVENTNFPSGQKQRDIPELEDRLNALEETIRTFDRLMRQVESTFQAKTYELTDLQNNFDRRYDSAKTAVEELNSSEGLESCRRTEDDHTYVQETLQNRIADIKAKMASFEAAMV